MRNITVLPLTKHVKYKEKCCRIFKFKFLVILAALALILMLVGAIGGFPCGFRALPGALGGPFDDV